MKKTGISILSVLIGAILGAGVMGKVSTNKTKKFQSMSDKHLALFLMMNQWIKVRQKGKKLADYFEKEGYQRIAIYGMSYAGETLLDELKDTDITVVYGIDKKADSLYLDVDIVTMDADLEEVDAIVVTAITFFDEIEEQLTTKIDCPVISLEDIVYGL